LKGLRAVKQLRADDWEDVEMWIKEWNPVPFKVIVKPTDSAGSDSVLLCINLEEVKHAFDQINGKVNGLGLINKVNFLEFSFHHPFNFHLPDCSYSRISRGAGICYRYSK
jgi:predicted ATP-grasp superfamily ATP-dependent carboligase